jgi:apolipoprotein N-acyltransferase
VEAQVRLELNKLLRKAPEAEVVVLSEYTFLETVPDRIKRWCRDHHRYLVVGGKEPAPNGNFYNTVFVVGPNGEVVFRQVKSVPIQFFKDGLRAKEQTLWESPWGPLGVCICYDLSYTRVTDKLARLGAKAIIVPTMDVADWGPRQHELHARVARVRAAEYGVPVFRLASSGISQFVDRTGAELARAGFPGEGEIIQGTLELGKAASRPLDRWLAPICVWATAAICGWLVFIGLHCVALVAARPPGLPHRLSKPPRRAAAVDLFLLRLQTRRPHHHQPADLAACRGTKPLRTTLSAVGMHRFWLNLKGLQV